MIACRVIAALCSLCIAVGCGSATKPDYSELPNDDSESGLVSIAYLKSRCKGLSTTIKSDVSIKGTVVANDLFGEFYKSIVLVDASGGVEVSIDCERLYTEFPLYANVSISCNGLAVGRVGGKVVLGAVPTGEYTVDRIVEDDISKYMLWQRGDVTSAVPRKVTIESFGVEHVSDYVMLEGVRFADDEVGRRGVTPWTMIILIPNATLSILREMCWLSAYRVIVNMPARGSLRVRAPFAASSTTRATDSSSASPITRSIFSL